MEGKERRDKGKGRKEFVRLGQIRFGRLGKGREGKGRERRELMEGKKGLRKNGTEEFVKLGQVREVRGNKGRRKGNKGEIKRWETSGKRYNQNIYK